MTSVLSAARPQLSFQCARLIARTSPSAFKRAVSTLPNNEHIYIHPQANNTALLSLLPNSPPIPFLAIGTTPKTPPTPDSLTENHDFFPILHSVIREHAVNDPDVQAQAGMYASQAGSALGSGGVFFPQQRKQKKRRGESGAKGYGGGGATGGDGAGGASAQGGMGGAGRGGWIHVSDQRQPPDFGRVAWPEDIFGSLEIDGDGKFVDGHGRYQESGTYRMCTNEGVLCLSKHLREKLVQRLRELDAQARSNS